MLESSNLGCGSLAVVIRRHSSKSKTGWEPSLSSPRETSKGETLQEGVQ